MMLHVTSTLSKRLISVWFQTLCHSTRMPTTWCVSAVTRQLSNPERPTTTPEWPEPRGQSKLKPRGWSSALRNPDSASGQPDEWKPRRWHQVGICADPTDPHLPFPRRASMLKGKRWPYFTFTSTCKNFQCFTSVKLSSHWRRRSIKATGNIKYLKYLSESGTPFGKENIL